MPRSDDAYQTTALPQARGSDHAGSTLCEPASSYRGRDKPPPSCPAASSGEKWLRDALCALNASRPAEAGVAGGALARNGDGGALDDGACSQAQRDDGFVCNAFNQMPDEELAAPSEEKIAGEEAASAARDCDRRRLNCKSLRRRRGRRRLLRISSIPSRWFDLAQYDLSDWSVGKNLTKCNKNLLNLG